MFLDQRFDSGFVVSIDPIPEEGDEVLGNHEDHVARISGLEVQTMRAGDASLEPWLVADALCGKANLVFMMRLNAVRTALLFDGNQNAILAMLEAHPPGSLIELAAFGAGDGETIRVSVKIVEPTPWVAAARENPALAPGADFFGARETGDVRDATSVATGNFHLH